MNLLTFRRKKIEVSKYPKRPDDYVTPLIQFLRCPVSPACLEAWRSMFDYLESKQDMIDIRDGLTGILNDDNKRQEDQVPKCSVCGEPNHATEWKHGPDEESDPWEEYVRRGGMMGWAGERLEEMGVTEIPDA